MGIQNQTNVIQKNNHHTLPTKNYHKTTPPIFIKENQGSG